MSDDEISIEITSAGSSSPAPILAPATVSAGAVRRPAKKPVIDVFSTVLLTMLVGRVYENPRVYPELNIQSFLKDTNLPAKVKKDVSEQIEMLAKATSMDQKDEIMGYFLRTIASAFG